MDENIHLEQLTKNGKKLEKALKEGKLIAARAKDDFLYLLDGGDVYQMFSHTAGSPDAGRRTLEKGEKNDAVIRQLGKMADAVFAVEFDRGMDLPSVLYSTESAILSSFPPQGEGGKFDFRTAAGQPAPSDDGT